MSIGEFARRSRLSPKALRIYDGLGLLSPARVDEFSGYRYYERSQLEQAGLIVTLRHVGVPLAAVKEWLELDPAGMAERVTTFWREADARHAAQQKLVTVEPAHREAYVDLGPGGPIDAAQWQLADEALRAWAGEQGIDPEQLALKPEDLGVRITYLASGPPSETSAPECDFAVPFA